MPCTQQPQKIHILVDTREQRPLKFDDYKVERATLETGDYTTAALRGRVAVERKSLTDLAGSLTEARFTRELQRSRGLEEFHIVVSAGLNEILQWPYGAGLPRSVVGKIRTNGAYLLRKVVEISSEYDCWVWFADSEANAARLVLNILKTAESKYVDAPPAPVLEGTDL